MRIKKIYQGSIPANKILNAHSTSPTDTYSCKYLNDLELTSEITFTKNEADNIFYDSIYATENEVQICGDIRYSYTSGTNLKAFTIDSKYLPIINNEDNKLRYPISTDKGSNGYAEVKPNGEVYIYTNGVATATYINIRYRYK